MPVMDMPVARRPMMEARKPPHAAGDQGHDVGLDELQVDAEDGGLGDAQQGAEAGGISHLLGLVGSGLDGHSQDSAGLGHVAAGADGVQIVPAVLGQHADLQEVEDMVDAEDAQQLAEAAVQEAGRCQRAGR